MYGVCICALTSVGLTWGRRFQIWDSSNIDLMSDLRLRSQSSCIPLQNVGSMEETEIHEPRPANDFSVHSCIFLRDRFDIKRSRTFDLEGKCTHIVGFKCRDDDGVISSYRNMVSLIHDNFISQLTRDLLRDPRQTIAVRS